jgi:transposase InsO family protein
MALALLLSKPRSYLKVHHFPGRLRALAWFAELGVQVERVLTDNGWCYRSAAFQQVLAEAGAAHRRTRPYRPQTMRVDCRGRRLPSGG